MANILVGICPGQSKIIDGRSWAGDAAEEPWRRGQRHPAARSHDRHRIQLHTVAMEQAVDMRHRSKLTT